MTVQAEVSLYPLRTPTLTESVERFVEHMRREGPRVEIGPMSSRITGECKDVFRALSGAFEEAIHHGDVVLTVKASNACPGPAGDGPAPADQHLRPGGDRS